jgi:hypothetical protein
MKPAMVAESPGIWRTQGDVIAKLRIQLSSNDDILNLSPSGDF